MVNETRKIMDELSYDAATAVRARIKATEAINPAGGRSRAEALDLRDPQQSPGITCRRPRQQALPHPGRLSVRRIPGRSPVGRVR